MHLPGAYDPRLSVRLTPAQGPQGAARSRKLLIAVILLAILPLALPFPFSFLAGEWIMPTIAPQFQQCLPYTCLTDRERLEWLLFLGPSFLVAVASLLLGTIGLVRTRWHPTSPKNMALFRACLNWGVVWMLLLGCIYWGMYWLAGVVP
jgi:hypothetical protein